MNKTYKAIEVSRPGELQLVTRPIREPGPRQVHLKVEAAGICHSDTMAIEGRRNGFLTSEV